MDGFWEKFYEAILGCECEKQGHLGLTHCYRARRDLSYYAIQSFHAPDGQGEAQGEQMTPSKSQHWCRHWDIGPKAPGLNGTAFVG